MTSIHSTPGCPDTLTPGCPDASTPAHLDTSTSRDGKIFIILGPWIHIYIEILYVYYTCNIYICCSVFQSCLTLCDPWTVACRSSLSITISQNLRKLMSSEPVILSNHLILCYPLLLPSVFPSISELSLCIMWPKYWGFNFKISPSNEYTGFCPNPKTLDLEVGHGWPLTWPAGC